MGKLKDAYNKCKPTDRQIKKQIKTEHDTAEFNKMRLFLEQRWNNTVAYSCNCCLKEAYYSELNGTCGYVTDEELVLSSNNKLKYK